MQFQSRASSMDFITFVLGLPPCWVGPQYVPRMRLLLSYWLLVLAYRRIARARFELAIFSLWGRWDSHFSTSHCGDFYWIKSLKTISSLLVYVSTMDCTSISKNFIKLMESWRFHASPDKFYKDLSSMRFSIKRVVFLLLIFSIPPRSPSGRTSS